MRKKKNPDAVKTAIANYESNIALATEKSKEVKDKGQAETLLNSIANNNSRNQDVLATVLIKVPEEAKAAVTQAIEASRKGQEEATKQIAELKSEVEQLKQEVAELKKESNDPQANEVEKLKKQVEELKKKQDTTQSTPKQTTLTTQNSQEQKRLEEKPKTTMTTLPNGAIVEMDANGNIIRTIKEAPQQTYIAPVPTTQSQNQTCTADVWSCSDWLECSTSSFQTRTCNKTFECPLVVTPPPPTSQSCTPPAPTCQSDTWECGNWNSCSASGNQTRSCTKTYDCSSVNTLSPIITQSCTPPVLPPTPIPTPIQISYSDYNFDYKWEDYYWAVGLIDGKILTCPQTSRTIIVKKAVFNISDSDALILKELKEAIKNPSTERVGDFNAYIKGFSGKATALLEQRDDNTFLLIGVGIPICSGSAMIVHMEGRIVNQNTGETIIHFTPEIISQFSEWEVWDYTTNKPVKIIQR